MGVLQGSVIAPVLFLLYINNMCASSTLQLIHFADATTNIASDDTERSLFDNVNRELSSNDEWL